MTMNSTVDPITLEIMRNRFQSAAEEACAALVRASYSTNIKDRRDCSAAICTPDGQVVAQAEVGTPLHLGIMPGVVRAVLTEFPAESMEPGDMYITNLPYPEGPGHLPDLSMVSAIYHEGQLIALAASTAHHVDMGGYAPGSMPFGVTEIYQEGLQIPPTRIFHRGVIDQAILNIINQNVRTHGEVRGDLMAQFAAANIAQRRVIDIVDRTSRNEVRFYSQAVLDHAEQCMRAGIASLPDGTYAYEDWLDDDGVVDEPVKIAVTVTITGDELVADFAGTSDQVLGPLNARISAARSATYYVCKAVIDPNLPTCAGAYRPIDVRASEGSLLQATYPAAIGNANIITAQRVVDAMLGAFYQAVPDRVCAACSGEMNLVNIGGIDPRSGDYYNYVETYGGGQGAMHDRDGQDGIHTHLTNTRNAPVEVIERTYPLEVLRYGLIPDSEGAGKFRGGCGMVRELRCLGDRVTITIGSDRRRFTPWGIETDHRARGAYCHVTSPNGQVRELPTKVVAVLEKGDVLCVETPGGGGWGNPREREREAIDQDVREGLISADRAAAVYGA
jgi:N-methylhydantoinase B